MIFASMTGDHFEVQAIHKPNPVLVAYREYSRPIPVALFIKGWWYPDVVKGWSDAGFARRHHAYKVLSRYLAVFGDDA